MQTDEKGISTIPIRIVVKVQKLAKRFLLRARHKNSELIKRDPKEGSNELLNFRICLWKVEEIG
jgi:hypothetical protein